MKPNREHDRAKNGKFSNVERNFLLHIVYFRGWLTLDMGHKIKLKLTTQYCMLFFRARFQIQAAGLLQIHRMAFSVHGII